MGNRKEQGPDRPGPKLLARRRRTQERNEMHERQPRLANSRERSILSSARNLLLLLTLAAFPGASTATTSVSIRVALDDIPGVDMLNFLTAVEHAKARGLAVTVSYLRSENIAVQAVLLGQADVGMGTPYAIIQQTDALIRMVFQLNTLCFFPVVNTDFYKTWQDLDGADMYTHGRGSGTEAVMNLMARKHGITYNSMQYLPGSGVRARAMLQGRIKASAVDSRRRKMLLHQGQGRFAVLPTPQFHASDETLYVRTAFLEENSAAIDILLEELLKVWGRINRNPEYMVDAWKKYGLLLPGAGKNGEDEVRRYYSEMVELGAFPDDGGGRRAVLADFDFYGTAGTLQGDVGKLRVEDYWDLEPLKRALTTVQRTY